MKICFLIHLSIVTFYNNKHHMIFASNEVIASQTPSIFSKIIIFLINDLQKHKHCYQVPFKIDRHAIHKMNKA